MKGFLIAVMVVLFLSVFVTVGNVINPKNGIEERKIDLVICLVSVLLMILIYVVCGGVL